MSALEKVILTAVVLTVAALGFSSAPAQDPDRSAAAGPQRARRGQTSFVRRE